VNEARAHHQDSETAPERRRILLLGGSATYRSGAFRSAAQRLGLEIVEATDTPAHYYHRSRSPLPIDFSDQAGATDRVVKFVSERPVAAVVAVDDSATLIAAQASRLLGLPHNDPGSIEAARDKIVMRQAFARAGMPIPWFRPLSSSDDPHAIAQEIRYPCVVKPARLAGSRGVIRADSPAEFVEAFRRTKAIVLREEANRRHEMLVEEYLPGVEVAVEGLLSERALKVLAIFDKPDPLEGPFFEETIYVTPSRLSHDEQVAIEQATGQAAAAIGLCEGPIHAELRIDGDQVWVIEIAGRSIGGLCSTILEFGAGATLEELILASAVGKSALDTSRRESVGVMMIPIPRSGMLRSVEGTEKAALVSGITGLEITAKVNTPIAALPEGASYLGFIFAQGQTPEEVESALRDAHRQLEFKIDPIISLNPAAALSAH
jgi:biotin carboxylase